MSAPRGRGRRRKGAARHPGGKLKQRSSAERADEIMAVARDARRRVHGLSKTNARRAEGGDLLGRLSLSGEITRQQFDAGRGYASLKRDYDRAMLARRLVSAADLRGPGGPDHRDGSDPGYRAWVQGVLSAYDRTRRALAESPDPLAAMVLDGVVLDGRQMWRFIGTLRIALNAVGRVLSR